MEQVPDVATVLARADRAWCESTADDRREPEYIAALAAAVRGQVVEPLAGGSGPQLDSLQRQLVQLRKQRTEANAAAAGVQVELANTRALLGLLVKAVTGSWRVRNDHAEQVAAAVEEVERVRAYLLSLHEPQARAG